MVRPPQTTHPCPIFETEGAARSPNGILPSPVRRFDPRLDSPRASMRGSLEPPAPLRPHCERSRRAWEDGCAIETEIARWVSSFNMCQLHTLRYVGKPYFNPLFPLSCVGIWVWKSLPYLICTPSTNRFPVQVWSGPVHLAHHPTCWVSNLGSGDHGQLGSP